MNPNAGVFLSEVALRPKSKDLQCQCPHANGMRVPVQFVHAEITSIPFVIYLGTAHGLRL